MKRPKPRQTGERPRRSRIASTAAAIADTCETRFAIAMQEIEQHETRLELLESVMLMVAAKAGVPF